MVVTVPRVIASQRVGAKRRPMTGSAKQSREKQEDWIASSLALLASDGGGRTLPSLPGRRRQHSPARRIVGEGPGCAFAARSCGDQERRCQQDRRRQRRGNQYDRCFHRYPIAMLITARCREEIANAWMNGLEK
jgi:hypothetical protein